MKAPINRIIADIKMSLVYTCSICGKKQAGTSFYFRTTGSSSDDLKEIIDGVRLTSANMPVGWGYCDKFYCECAKGVAA